MSRVVGVILGIAAASQALMLVFLGIAVFSPPKPTILHQTWWTCNTMDWNNCSASAPVTIIDNPDYCKDLTAYRPDSIVVLLDDDLGDSNFYIHCKDSYYTGYGPNIPGLQENSWNWFDNSDYNTTGVDPWPSH